MIEVEAKAKIESPDEIRNEIKKRWKYLKKEDKIDDYYTLQDLRSYPTRSLRIRKKGKEYVINFKRRISFEEGIFAKKEVEFKVTDIQGFIQLIEDFGFRKWLRKEKKTELYEIKKNFHIELNYVKNLGWFVEVEYLCDDKDISKARKEVKKVLKKLKINRKKIAKDGYTKMLWEGGYGIIKT